MPLDKACLIGCCVSTGYGATLNTVKVTKNGWQIAHFPGGRGARYPTDFFRDFIHNYLVA